MILLKVISLIALVVCSFANPVPHLGGHGHRIVRDGRHLNTEKGNPHANSHSSNQPGANVEGVSTSAVASDAHSISSGFEGDFGATLNANSHSPSDGGDTIESGIEGSTTSFSQGSTSDGLAHLGVAANSHSPINGEVSESEASTNSQSSTYAGGSGYSAGEISPGAAAAFNANSNPTDFSEGTGAASNADSITSNIGGSFSGSEATDNPDSQTNTQTFEGPTAFNPRDYIYSNATGFAGISGPISSDNDFPYSYWSGCPGSGEAAWRCLIHLQTPTFTFGGFQFGVGTNSNS